MSQEGESDIPILEQVLLTLGEALTRKWTAELYQAFDVKPSDLFVVYHAAFKSLSHLVGELSTTDNLALDYSSRDLRLSSGSPKRHYQ